MESTRHSIDRAFEGLSALIQLDPTLAAELVRAGAIFGLGVPDDEHSAALWRRRLEEWFVLERPTEATGVPPLDELLVAARERQIADVLDAAVALRGSLVGVFEVTGVEADRGLWLCDLATRGEYPANEPEAARIFQRGDLVAGRIFPLADGSWHISRAAAFYRSVQLLEALRRDLERARGARRGFARVAQLEIERMFFGVESRLPEDPVGEARTLLLSSGVEREEVESIFERLAEVPFDRESIVLGTDDELGEMLDRLAFDSSVDLDQARRLLILAWSDLSRRGPGGPPTSAGSVLQPMAGPRDTAAMVAKSGKSGNGPPDVTRAMAEFERRRQLGVPLERAFQELETELQLDVEADEDDLAPAPDFPGVVGAVIEEFLWEQGAVEGVPVDAELQSVRLFGRFAANIGVFENLTQRDLLAYTCHWLPESDELVSADAVRSHLSAFGRFLRWVEETQGLALLSDFRPTLKSIESSLPRCIEANRRRTRTTDPEIGDLYEFVAPGAGEAVRLRNRVGDETEVAIDHEIAHWLKPGDLLRAHVLGDRRVAVYCCYPPEARELEGR